MCALCAARVENHLAKNMQTSHLAKLEALLSETLLKDRFALRRDLQRLKRTRDEKRHAKVDQQVVALEKKIRASAARRTWRVRNRPRFVYDSSLPITAKKDKIIRAIQAHQVVIISGETGSGKSTQIPKFCLAAGRGIDAKIGCTQPRRIAASAIARRVAQELGQELGGSVGYKIRFKDRTHKNAFIKIMTDGIMLAEAQGDPYLTEYDTIIVDEAHERSLNIDFVLGLLTTLLKKRSELKLIITSATIDTEKFSRAFDQAPVIEVSGRMYPVDVIYYNDDPLFKDGIDPENEEPNYVETAVDAVGKIIATGFDGDILVFMPTEQDIRETCEMLEGQPDVDAMILPLYARLSGDAQARVFARSPHRKIIVATNVAETSLTIPGVKYVVDTGLARILRYNPRSRTTALPIVPISRSSADQRKGRCGRVEKGVCIRLFGEEDFEQRSQFTLPEILRSNLAEVILRMIALNLGDINDFPFIDRPIAKSIKDGFNLLQELGAIVEVQRAERTDRRAKGRRLAAKGKAQRPGIEIDRGDRYRLTKKGRLMARLPIDPRLSCMMLEARHQGCLAEITIIAAALSIQDPRERPAEEARQADQIHARFYEPSSDFLTLLNIWNRYHATWKQVKSNNQMKKYCKAHYLSFKRMREWRDIHHQICEILAENVPTHPGKQIMDAKLRFTAIHKSILSGFLSNIAVRKEKNIFKAAKGREVMIFPGSSLFNSAGEWIVAAEMVETSRLFARTTAGIDPGWLEDLGRDLCRYTHLNPRWSRKRGEVVASEQVSLFGLIIVSQRTVSYGRIDPDEASDIFIRQALIAGDVRRPLPFMQYNQKLVDEVRSMEDRIRRRDVLVSEDELYRFYKDKLDDICDIRGLERFIKKKRSDVFLRLKKEDLLLYEPEPEVLSQFPDRVRLGSNDYPCSYLFEPGTQADGLTVKVSSDVAPLVPAEEIDWLVPGLLGEKITTLIKGLPKKYRKKLVPVTETVELVLKEMPKTEEPLITALANFIYTRFGLNIPASAWSTESLPEYLNMRVAITGPGGEVLRAGRDRSILKQDLSNDLHLDQWESPRKSWEKTDITCWDFGDLPESIELQLKGAAAWTLYPGLAVDSNNKNRIDLRLFRHRDTALESHIKGVAALYAVYFSKDLRFLKKNLTLPPELDRPASYFGGARKVEQRMYACVVGKLFRKNIRTQDAFLKHATVAAQKILTTGRKHCEQVLPILQGHHESRSAIYQLEAANKANSAFSQFLNTLKHDLTQLVPENFVELYDLQRLLHIQRYLKAAAIRAERAAVNFEKDRVKAEQVGKFTAGLDELLETLSPATTGEKKNAVEEFFWMLEEFKVSLFAQELGTAVPVSAKRLEKKLAEIERMV